MILNHLLSLGPETITPVRPYMKLTVARTRSPVVDWIDDMMSGHPFPTIRNMSFVLLDLRFGVLFLLSDIPIRLFPLREQSVVTTDCEIAVLTDYDPMTSTADLERCDPGR